MLKKCICFLWALAIVVAMGLQVTASEQTGSIQIIPKWCTRPVAGGTVRVRYIGEEIAEGYCLTDGLANWIVAKDALDDDLEIGTLGYGQEENRFVAPIEEETGAAFYGLKKGVYYVEQLETASDYLEFKPFFLTLPAQDMWHILAEPELIYTGESPKTGDHPAPIIAAMGLGLSVAVLMVLVDDHKR